MEKIKTTAPKTIQIKYPAPYAQPWTMPEEDAPIATKLIKRKSPINSYSAQSWKVKEKNVVKLKPKRPLSSQQSQPLGNAKNPRSSIQFGLRPCRPPIRRLEASASHLKYGLFPSPRKPVGTGSSLSNAITSKPSLKKRANPTESSRKERKCKMIAKNDSKAFEKNEIDLPDSEEQPSDVPTLVFRPLSRRYTHKLATSHTVHMDIKPGKNRIGSSQKARMTLI